MTNLAPLTRFVETELPEYVESKENPEEWYVLIGSHATEYSVWADAPIEDGYEEHQAELPPEDRDANPNAEGYMQFGTVGWLSEVFDFPEDNSGFVSESQWGDKIDKALLNILVVHESVLTDEAIAIANGDEEPEEVTTPDA